jgi:hypothetical protein
VGYGMGCWRWFNSLLTEAGLEVTDKNREKIDDVIHRFIGEKSSYGRCSSDWKKARKEIKTDVEMKQELVKRLLKIV